jgi:hypothetical protein
MPLFSFQVAITYHDSVVIDADDEAHARQLIKDEGLTGSHVVDHVQDVDPEIDLELDEDD